MDPPIRLVFFVYKQNRIPKEILIDKEGADVIIVSASDLVSRNIGCWVGGKVYSIDHFPCIEGISGHIESYDKLPYKGCCGQE